MREVGNRTSQSDPEKLTPYMKSWLIKKTGGMTKGKSILKH